MLKQYCKKIVTNKVVLYLVTRYMTYAVQFITSIWVAVKLGPFYLGIWGMLLFVLIQIGIFLRVKLRIVYLFSMFVLLVLLHRAWMLGASYLFLLVLLAVHAYSYYNSSPKNIIK